MTVSGNIPIKGREGKSLPSPSLSPMAGNQTSMKDKKKSSSGPHNSLFELDPGGSSPLLALKALSTDSVLDSNYLQRTLNFNF